jgi:hypothetical protein
MITSNYRINHHVWADNNLLNRLLLNPIGISKDYATPEVDFETFEDAQSLLVERMVGVALERWLFFSQAKHSVQLYYGKEEA